MKTASVNGNLNGNMYGNLFKKENKVQKMKSIKCDNCGASIEVNYEKLIGFCPFCGTQLYFDINQVEDILKERERTRQVELRENGLTQRAQYENEKVNKAIDAKKIVTLSILCVWIFSVVFLSILSIMTLDSVNFSPYQLILILDFVGGIILLKNLVKQ